MFVYKINTYNAGKLLEKENFSNIASKSSSTFLEYWISVG